MGRPQRSGFSGRNRGRCLRRFWPPWKSPLLPSALRDELAARLKGGRVAGAVIEPRFWLLVKVLIVLACRHSPHAMVPFHCTVKHPWSILHCNGEGFGLIYGTLKP